MAKDPYAHRKHRIKQHYHKTGLRKTKGNPKPGYGEVESREVKPTKRNGKPQSNAKIMSAVAHGRNRGGY